MGHSRGGRGHAALPRNRLCLVGIQEAFDGGAWLDGNRDPVTFMICIGTIGICAAFGGAFVDKKGPRIVATVGGILFGLGTMLAGLADYTGNIFMLYLGFGLIGGAGNGLAYVVPIATLVRWFPDRRGLVTGLAVMGFGAGAFFMGQIAPTMINQISIAKTWFIFGAVFLVLTAAMAQFFKNPPPGWLPPGFVPKAASVSTVASSWTFAESFSTRQCWMLWTMFFLNISAGVGLLSQLSPLAQEIQKGLISDPAQLAVAGGVVVSFASLFNGARRALSGLWSLRVLKVRPSMLPREC